jgi:GDP-L-fucose synthase
MGIKLCQSYNRQYGTNFIAAMPTNLYGPHDNFDLEKSHVVPAMIRKLHEARMRNDVSVTLWGYRYATSRIFTCRRSRECTTRTHASF